MSVPAKVARKAAPATVNLALASVDALYARRDDYSAVFGLTPAATVVGIEPLTGPTLGITLAAAAAGVALVGAGRRALALPQRL